MLVVGAGFVVLMAFVGLPAQAPDGWRPVVETGFDGAALPAACRTLSGPATESERDQLAISGGVLRLRTGGIACGEPQVHGRYEFRARAAPAAAVSSATLGPAVVPVTDSGAFHTYTIEWTPTALRTLVDGAVRGEDPPPADARQFALTVDPRGGSDGFVIDWLRIYAYAPGFTAPTTAAPDGGLLGPSDAGGPLLGPQAGGPRGGAGRWWIWLSGGAAFVAGTLAGFWYWRRRRRAALRR